VSGGPGRDAAAAAGAPDPLASATEQGARLAEAAGEWARRALPELVAVLRGERPEVTDRLAEAGAAVTAAVRAVLDTLASPPDRAPAPASPAERGAAGRVQRIELSDTP